MLKTFTDLSLIFSFGPCLQWWPRLFSLSWIATHGYKNHFEHLFLRKSNKYHHHCDYLQLSYTADKLLEHLPTSCITNSVIFIYYISIL